MSGFIHSVRLKQHLLLPTSLGYIFILNAAHGQTQGTSIGDGGPVDKFIYEEGDRIIKEYGNHPSFCMLAYGNEPAGRNQNEVPWEADNILEIKR